MMPGDYRSYFDRMPCYLSVHDRDLLVLEGNRRFREDFGDGIGQPCYQTYKQRNVACDPCPVLQTFEDGASHASEQQLETADGRIIPVMVHTTPIRDENGRIVCVMEMHTDISEALQLREQLDRSRHRLSRLFEEVPCYLTVQGRDLVIQNANRAFRESFGPAVGRLCYEVYKHREEQCLVCPALQTFEDGKTRAHEEVVTGPDGEKIHVLATTAPITNAAGEVVAVIEMSNDITQLRELQSQLTSIGLLVGSISHGIKGLLTGLDGGIYLVNTGFAKDNPQRVEKGWEMVERNVDRIRSMVQDILYYAKDRDLDVVDIDAAGLAVEVREILRKKAGDLDIVVEYDIPDDLGSFEGDRQAIRAMLLNIAENSLEACRADRHKVEHRVCFGMRRADPWMVFDVEDNGIGMDRQTREKIFSLFFSSKGIKGTGLGLFISNKIVEKHGGTIEVESEAGAGSRFRVRVPLLARPSTRPAEDGAETREGLDGGSSPDPDRR